MDCRERGGEWGGEEPSCRLLQRDEMGVVAFGHALRATHPRPLGSPRPHRHGHRRHQPGGAHRAPPGRPHLGCPDARPQPLLHPQGPHLLQDPQRLDLRPPVTPLERLILARVRCVRCGGGIECGCWVSRPEEMVTLRCPGCQRSQPTERKGLEVLIENGEVLSLCPDCRPRLQKKKSRSRSSGPR